MERESYYSINEVISFKIINNLSYFNNIFNDINNEFGNMQQNKKNIKKLDFIVHLGNFHHNNANSNVIGDRYFIKKNYFLCKKDTYKLSEWKIELFNYDKNISTIMRIQPNVFGSMYITLLINSLIDFKLNQKGYSFLHGSCVCNKEGNNGYIFISPSGGGKTLTALSLVENGYKLIGDDYVIVSNDVAIGFPSTLNISKYNQTSLIRKKINKFSIQGKSLFFYLTRGYFQIHQKFNFYKYFPNMTMNKCSINKIYILIRGKDFLFEEINKKQFIERIIVINEMEFKFILKNNILYSYIFPNDEFSTYRKYVKQNLENNFINCKFYNITIPTSCSSNELIIYIKKVLEEGK